MLISDDGYRGIAIKLTGEFDKIYQYEKQKLYCGSSAMLSQACIEAQKLGLSGLEFAFGIPGTCGGALCMNAGAYGMEMSSVIEFSSHIDENGKIGNFDKKKLNFAYRKSIYSSGRFVVTSIVFSLVESDKEKIKQKMQNLMLRRKSKQPLELPSAGSIFKRPTGYYAGNLIQKCGLKGKKIGGAAVSEKHSGFIVNTGNATCQNVLDLIDIIKTKVFNETKVQLEEEIKKI
jgi:UDP-N-acetylmuramate dehydrogenase